VQDGVGDVHTPVSSSSRRRSLFHHHYQDHHHHHPPPLDLNNAEVARPSHPAKPISRGGTGSMPAGNQPLLAFTKMAGRILLCLMIMP
jgi:hypothetical protein